MCVLAGGDLALLPETAFAGPEWDLLLLEPVAAASAQVGPKHITKRALPKLVLRLLFCANLLVGNLHQQARIMLCCGGMPQGLAFRMAVPRADGW